MCVRFAHIFYTIKSHKKLTCFLQEEIKNMAGKTHRLGRVAGELNVGISTLVDFLQSKVDDGHIQAFTGNEYIQALEGGDVTAVIAWSGDIGQMGADYGFDLPETGGSIFVDNVLIPAGAEHKANAE